MTARRTRKGEGLVEGLLILTVAAVAVVWFAYGHLPGFEAAIGLFAEEIAPILGFD